MTDPTIDQVRALNGRYLAMLSLSELDVFRFYRDRGRKYGVSITVTGNADAEKLAQAASPLQAEKILMRGHGKISVMVQQS